MHLLIPFAAPLSEAGRQAAASLVLPRLQSLLARCTEVQRDSADEWSFSPPHERALALALGWRGPAGLLPWAARAAQADGITTADLAWGLMTPAHWHLGTEQVSLIDPAGLMLDEPAARAFFDAVAPLFTSEGFAIHYATAQRWYLAHPSLAGLATASIDRVIGRNVDGWLGKDPAAQRLRRLQAEVQMLLYTHPLNDERAARGLLPVNSFWLSGCGVAQAQAEAGAEVGAQAGAQPPPAVDGRLRGPALADDWAAWCQAWETLDAGPLAALLARAEAGQPAALTLCGERAWARFEAAPRSVMKRLRGLWTRSAPATLLETL